MNRSFAGTLRAGVLLLALVGVTALVGCKGRLPQGGTDVERPADASGQSGGRSGPAAAGDPAPDFDLPKAGGGRAKLSDYEGKILVLDFWGTRCLGCIEELPEYQKLYDSWDHDEVEYLGPANDIRIEIVEAFLERKKLTLPMALIDDAMKQAYMGDQAVLPQARVIDQKGVVRHLLVTDPSASKVKQLVDELLAEAE